MTQLPPGPGNSGGAHWLDEIRAGAPPCGKLTNPAHVISLLLFTYPTTSSFHLFTVQHQYNIPSVPQSAIHNLYLTALDNSLRQTATMVHLASIPNDSQIKKDDKSMLAKGVEKLQLGSSAAIDSFTTSVYGSRFAAEDLPKHVMPEDSMPKEVAYRMIKDDLSLDGNPMLK